MVLAHGRARKSPSAIRGLGCDQDDLLSLALCKPMIRRRARRGDLVKLSWFQDGRVNGG